MLKLLERLLHYIYRLLYLVLGKLAIINNGGLHPKRDLLRYEQWFLDNLEQSDHVIDIGCGDGSLLQHIHSKVSSCVGLDLSERNLQKARSKAIGDRCTLVHCDAMTYDYNQLENINVVVLSNSLEHFKDRIDLLKSVHDLIKGKWKARLLIRVPALDRDWISEYACQNNFSYKLDRTHYIEYTEKDLYHELTAAQFKIVKISRRYDEYFVSAELFDE